MCDTYSATFCKKKKQLFTATISQLIISKNSNLATQNGKKKQLRPEGKKPLEEIGKQITSQYKTG
jgi:hypothetical protein